MTEAVFLALEDGYDTDIRSKKSSNLLRIADIFCAPSDEHGTRLVTEPDRELS